MGLFSSKRKTYTGMQSSRLLEDADIPDIAESTRFEMALAKDRRVDAFDETFTEMYNRNYANSLGAKALNYRTFAKNKYHYGVLEGYQIKEGNINLPQIFADFMLEKNDIQVGINYIKLGPINNHHAVFQILEDNFNYSLDTNTLRVSGNSVYLKDFVVYYAKHSYEDTINIDYLNPLGLPATFGETPTRTRDTKRKHTDWDVDLTADEDYALVTTVNSSGVETTIRIAFNQYDYSNIRTTIEDAPIPEDAVMGEDYFMVQYTHNGTTKTYTYMYGSLGEPILDRSINTEADPGKYLPQIYITWDRAKLNSDSRKDTEAYKTSRAYCRMLGLSYTEMVDNLWDSIAKDTEEVKDIFISHRLPALTQDPLIVEYMYHFFYEMYKDNGGDKVRSDFTELKSEDMFNQAREGMSLQFKDRLTDTYVTYTNLGVRTVQGSIGPIGSVKMEYADLGSIPQAYRRGLSPSIPVHKYMMQITATTYRVISVQGLSSSMNMSSGNWNTVAGDSEDLLIPIDVDVVNLRMRRNRQEVLLKSMYVMINTLKVVKSKWYETGIFKVVVFMIGVAISVATAGSGTPLVAAIMKAIVVGIAITIATTIAAKLLVAAGIDAGVIAAVIAVVAVIAGAYAHLSKTTVAGLNAVDFMAIANPSFQISNKSFALEMQKEIDAFNEYKDMYDTEMQALADLREELGLNTRVQLDVYTLMAQSIRTSNIRLGESPISFLERTTSVSAGYLPNAVVQNFVYLTTTLPTFESFVQKRNSQYV